MKLGKAAVGVLAALAVAAGAAAEPPAGSLAAVPDGRYARLARGVNLTGWFSYGGDTPLTPITDGDLALIAASGFTHVRVPVDPRWALERDSPPAAVAATLAGIDAAVDRILARDLAVVIDVHPDAAFEGDLLAGPEGVAELVGLWRTLASRYAGRDPDRVFFEIMNEPDFRFSPDAWGAIQTEVLAAIRAAAPGHTVLVTGPPASSLDALAAMPVAPDPNTVYVVHFYEPFVFTQQGATWTTLDWIAGLAGVPYPAYLAAAMVATVAHPVGRAQVQAYIAEGWDGGRVDARMDAMAAWARARGVRVVVNEFGVYKRAAPADSRLRWLRDVRTAAERHGIGWTMWDYLADGFGLVVEDADGARDPDPGVLAALGLSAGSIPEAPVEAFLTRLYALVLGRDPSPAELSAWAQYLVASPTPAAARALVHAFLDGPEFLARPTTTAAYVALLYRVLLGREPDPAEVAGWAAALSGGLDAAVGVFVSAPEFAALAPDLRDPGTVGAAVIRLYEGALGRSPAPAEVGGWVAQVVASGAMLGAARGVFDSPEYASIARTLAGHVTALYRALLGRSPLASEVGPWVGYLAGTRGAVEDAFLGSPEFSSALAGLLP